MAKVDIDVLVQIGKSLDELKKLKKQGNDTTGSLADGFKSVKVLAGAAVAAFAGSKFVGFLKDAANEAAIAEENISRLSASLKIAGNFSEDAISGLSDFATEIQRTTRFSDDAVLSNLAYLQSLTKLNTQGLKVAQSAAIDLSAALKVDLQTATQLVGRAANGEVGSFTRYGLAIQKGATNAETFGNVLRLLNKDLGGKAAADIDNFNGRLAQNQNIFSDLLEVIGDLIIKNPKVIETLGEISKSFLSIIDVIKNNQKQITEIVNFFADVAKFSIRAATAVTKFAIGIPKALGVGNVPKTLADYRNRTVGFSQALNKASVEAANLNKNLNGINKTKNDTKVEIPNNINDLGNFSDPKLDDEGKKKLVSEISGGNIGILLGLQPGAGQEQLSKQEQATAATASLLAKASQGAAGATSLISGVVSGIANTLLPGIGGAVGQIFEVLAKGPEETKKFFSEFFKSIPIIIQSIVESIPVLIQTIIEEIPTLVLSLINFIIEGLPDIIVGFIENIPKIIQGFVAQIPTIITALVFRLPIIIQTLASQMPFIALKLLIELQKIMPQLAVSMIQEFVKEAPKFVQALIDSIFGALGDAGDFLGDVGSSIGGFFGFAEGGLVPAGFPDDSFPARLTSGEFVANNDLTKKLDAFLSGQGGGGSQQVTVNMVVSEKNLASAIFDLNQRGFRTA